MHYFYKAEAARIVYGSTTVWRMLGFNPNPHGLKALTKLTASGLKRSTTTLPHAQHCGLKGGGSRLLYTYSPEDLLNFKFTFLCKTAQTKKFAKIFSQAFLIFKKIYLRHQVFIIDQRKKALLIP
jgi:hypothetical protein